MIINDDKSSHNALDMILVFFELVRKKSREFQELSTSDVEQGVMGSATWLRNIGRDEGLSFQQLVQLVSVRFFPRLGDQPNQSSDSELFAIPKGHRGSPTPPTGTGRWWVALKDVSWFLKIELTILKKWEKNIHRLKDLCSQISMMWHLKTCPACIRLPSSCWRRCSRLVPLRRLGHKWKPSWLDCYNMPIEWLARVTGMLGLYSLSASFRWLNKANCRNDEIFTPESDTSWQLNRTS